MSQIKETGGETERECTAESLAVPRSITKEEKKALSNFRDQLRYKDYKGLVWTLQVLYPLLTNPEECAIPEKYAARRGTVQENLLLLKNILISDVKHAISIERPLDKNAVLILTILSEKYLLDINSPITSWLSAATIQAHGKSLQYMKSLSEIPKILEKVLSIKDEVGLRTAHLPIWWNISRTILSDLISVVRSGLISLIQRGCFSDTEYLDALKACSEFERMYLMRMPKGRATNKKTPLLLVQSDAPEHIQILADISGEHPQPEPAPDKYPLSICFAPRIEIYITNELSALSGHILVFSGSTVHESVYFMYTLLTRVLHGILPFKTEHAGLSFISLADTAVSRAITASRFSNAQINFLGAADTIAYIELTSTQMIARVEQAFSLSSLQLPLTSSALNDLSNRVRASLSASIEKKLLLFFDHSLLLSTTTQEDLTTYRLPSFLSRHKASSSSLSHKSSRHNSSTHNTSTHKPSSSLHNSLLHPQSHPQSLTPLHPDSTTTRSPGSIQEAAALETQLAETMAAYIQDASEMIFASRISVIQEWCEVLDECIFRCLIRAPVEQTCAESFLCFMSALEVVLRRETSDCTHSDSERRETGEYLDLAAAKLYLKIFLVPPTQPETFVNNFKTISGGVFTFRQVLERVPKKYHQTLLEEYNQE